MKYTLCGVCLSFIIQKCLYLYIYALACIRLKSLHLHFITVGTHHYIYNYILEKNLFFLCSNFLYFADTHYTLS